MISKTTTTYTYYWYGAMPLAVFAFGKYAGFLPYSWWWALAFLLLTCRVKK